MEPSTLKWGQRVLYGGKEYTLITLPLPKSASKSVIILGPDGIGREVPLTELEESTSEILQDIPEL